MDTVEAEGLAKNTYIIYFSDHGDMHGSHGRIWKCVPWEESIRIPFFVALGNRPCGFGTKRPSPMLINHVDIAPTTLGLCGIAMPEWMGGVDYAPAFTAAGAEVTEGSLPDSAFLQLVDPGYEFGFASDRERPWRGVVTSDGWKYAVLEKQPWLMYHIEEDPYELANLAHDGRFRGQRRKLQDRLAAWIADTGDSFDLPDLWM
jgi:arylsulfatase A-like enzyme